MKKIVKKIIELSERYLEKRIKFDYDNYKYEDLEKIINEVNHKKNSNVSDLISGSDMDAWSNIIKTRRIDEIYEKIINLFNKVTNT